MSEKKRKSQGEEDTSASKRSKTSPENTAAKPKPLLSGKEHEDLRRFLRERKKFLVRQPHFELTAIGRAALTDRRCSSSSSEAIMASDVKLLLLYLMMGDKMQEAEIG